MIQCRTSTTRDQCLLVFFATFVGMITTPAKALPPSQSISYWLDLSLLYSDLAKRPNTSADNPPKKLDPRDDSQSKDGGSGSAKGPSHSPQRVLGLKAMKLGIKASAFGQSALIAVLRPDATMRRNTDDQFAEFDGRAGNNHRSRPSIELLDTYEIQTFFSPETYLSVGVFDQLRNHYYNYHSPLEHGLQVEFPQKTAAFRFHFELLDSSPPLPQESVSADSQFDIWIFQGNQDRGENWSYNASTYDEAPSSADPYLGVAANGLINIFTTGFLAGFAGYYDTKLQTSHVNESLLSLEYGDHLSWNSYTWHWGFEYRIARERWSQTEPRLGELTQRSLAWTNKVQLNPRWIGVVGYLYGVSETHIQDDLKNEIQKGYQTDLGIIYNQSQNIKSSLFMSTESRSSSIAPNRDGFTNSYDETSYLMRLALQIEYVMNQP